MPPFPGRALMARLRSLFRAVLHRDDVESDIGGAMRAGLAGILVRTGKYRDDAVRGSGVEPTITVDSIAAVPSLLDVDS